jgi:hypothetical protein
MTTPAAYLAIALLAGIALFQVGLAIGRPWGRAAWGGQHSGILPTRLRIASATAAAVYPLLIAYIASSAELARGWTLPGAGTATMWALAGFFLLGGVINAASQSPIERWWAPIALLVAACCALVALRA